MSDTPCKALQDTTAVWDKCVLLEHAFSILVLTYLSSTTTQASQLLLVANDLADKQNLPVSG